MFTLRSIMFALGFGQITYGLKLLHPSLAFIFAGIATICLFSKK